MRTSSSCSRPEWDTEIAAPLGELCVPHIDAVGEWMELEGLADEWFVAGHVPDTAAIAAVELEAEDVRLAVTRRAHGVWERDDADGCWIFYEDAAGWFPITVVEDADAAEHRAARRRRIDAAAERLRAFVLNWYPEAQDIDANGYGFDVRWRLPGLAHRVSWQVAQPTALHVARGDLEAWRKRYGNRKRPAVVAP